MAIIVFGEKSPLAAIPALGDVMGITRCRSIDER
jgi:hypothetical protein